MKNPNWRRAYISAIAALVFALLCVASFTLIDGMDGGFALAFVSIFLAISAIAVAGLFTYHALLMDAILAGNRLLAHWTYPDKEAHRSAEREYREYKERNRTLFFVVGGMLAAVALFFLLIIRDGGIETAAVLFAILVIIYIVSKIAPAIEFRRVQKAPHEAYIADNGVVYEGTVYPFRTFMMRMDGVGYHEGHNRKPPVVVFSFTQLIGLYIVQSFEVAVPVPEGCETRAREIADTLSSRS